VAKVMVSFPDEVLAAIDAEAARRGTTRSGFLHALADEALRQRAQGRQARSRLVMRDASPHGGDVAALVKRHRPR